MSRHADEPTFYNQLDETSVSSTASSNNISVSYTNYEDDNSVISTDDLDDHNDQFIGDILSETKDEKVTRIYTQNINGIKWTNEGGTWPLICETMSAIHADIACFTELNLDVNRYQLSTTMRTIESKFFSHSRFAGSTSKNKFPRTYKPGGTGMLIVENTTSTIKKIHKDRMGRWVVTHLTGHAGTKIAIIVAYQVCQSTTTGNATAANCQIAQLISERHSPSSIPNPRKAFIEELTKLIQKSQENDEAIILLGDFNEEMTGSDAPNNGIQSLATTCGLADVFSTRLGTTSSPVTYQRGNRRLDYVLVTPALLPAIRAAGYDPFNYRLPSDHRGFYIDFDTELLLGYRPSTLAPAAYRDFHSRQPRVVTAYITAITAELEHHDFWHRLNELKDTTYPRPLLAESLDRDLTRAKKHAANTVRRRYQTPWSPAFSKAWATVHFYKLSRSQIKNPFRDYSLAFAQMRSKYLHLPATTPSDPDEIRAGIRQAFQDLKSARQHAEALRNSYLEERAKLYAALDEKGNRKAVKRLKRAEALSRTYRKLSSLRRSTTSSGITELQVPLNPNTPPKECPTEDSYWRTERVPSNIEDLLLARNEVHFGQAEGTPFTTGSLKTALRYHGDGPIAELILDGQYDTTTVDNATGLFIDHLKKLTNKKLTGSISRKEIIDKLKTWNEKTSTSPSGIHLGHYHVLWRHHGLKPSNPLSETIESGQSAILDAHVTLMDYAMKFGHSYKRWQQVVNVMIMKEPGNPKIVLRLQKSRKWDARPVLSNS